MSYLSKSQSVGFIYFDTSGNNSSGLTETFDYIEFSNSSSQKGFSPCNSSSPQQFRHRNNYFRGKNNSKPYNRYYSTNNCRNYSRDNSYNTNYKQFDKQRSDNNDISEYYHPSMLEDPWAELEREMDPDSQDSSDPHISEPFHRYRVDSNTNLGYDTTDSQDEGQASTEESS